MDGPSADVAVFLAASIIGEMSQKKQKRKSAKPAKRSRTPGKRKPDTFILRPAQEAGTPIDANHPLVVALGEMLIADWLEENGAGGLVKKVNAAILAGGAVKPTAVPKDTNPGGQG